MKAVIFAAGLALCSTVGVSSVQVVRGVVRGKVLSDTSQEPTPGLTVLLTGSALLPSRQVKAVTDSEGSFSFLGIPQGAYDVEVVAPGYLGVTSQGRPGSVVQRISINLQRQEHDLTFRLIRSGTIAGRILDPDGRPLIGGTATAQSLTWQDGLRILNPVQSVTIDDQGIYRLFRLPPGHYIISGEPKEPESRNVRTTGIADSSRDLPVRTFFPGRETLSGAEVVQLQEGRDLTGISFSLRTTRTFRISGSVIAGLRDVPSQRLLTLFQLIQRRSGDVWDASIPTFRNAALSSSGRDQFEIRGVLPGTYDIYPVISEREATYSGRATVHVTSQDLSGIDITLRPNQQVRLRLVSTESQMPIGSEKISIRLVPQELLPVSVRQPIVTAAAMRGDGTFWFPSVPETRYAVKVYGTPASVYAAGIRQDGKSLSDAIVNIRSGGVKMLEIVFSPGAGAIVGVVTDARGNLARNAFVVLVPDVARRKNPLFYYDVRSDVTGSFALSSLAPGQYTVFAWENVEPSSWLDPQFLQEHESEGSAIIVRPRAETSIRLKAIPLE